MTIDNIIDRLLETEEYRDLFDRIMAYDRFNKEDALSILLALSFISNGKGEDAERLIHPLYEMNKDLAEMRYWYASALLLKAETIEECVEAKGIMLDAMDGLEGKMRDDAIVKLAYAEEKIDELTTKEN